MTTAAIDHEHTAYGHLEPVDIHFDDLDAMGLVHNARYAVLIERAMAAYWSRHGLSYSGGKATHPDVFHAVAEFSITYLAPIRGTGAVGIRFWLDRLGNTSGTYGFQVLSGDGSTVHAQGRRVVIKMDPRTLRPAPWTPEIRQLAAAIQRP